MNIAIRLEWLKSFGSWSATGGTGEIYNASDDNGKPDFQHVVIAQDKEDKAVMSLLSEDVRLFLEGLDFKTLTPKKTLLRDLVFPPHTDSGYELLQPIPAFIESDGCTDFYSSWWGAGIHTGGATEIEAIDNLKSLISDVFEMLLAERPEDLGIMTSQKLTVMKQYIKKK